MQYSKELFDSILDQLTFADLNERKAITFWLLEHYLNISRTDVLVNKKNPDDIIDWQPIVKRLNANEPIQYILGETTFFGRKFNVSPDVLIPRPETEELVQLIIPDLQKRRTPRLLDIGTGSGCLAVSLAAACPEAEVFALDISEKALKIAAQNAKLNNAEVTYLQQDILNPNIQLSVDVIVSNPPYVTNQEAAAMQANVMKYEPHLALFVPNENPLLFYEAIGEYASKNLTPDGSLYLEINENLGEETRTCIEKYGLERVRIIEDINGKQRFIAASQPGVEK